MADTADPTISLACLEVWGGNEIVDAHVRVPGLDVFVYALPFEHATAGGDVHFVSSCGQGRIARLMVADVSGHGSAVAETGRRLRSLIHRHMNHADQRQLLGAMNAQFAALAEAGQFATAVVMTYAATTARLTLCNAGHPPPLLRKGNAWRYLDDDAAEAMPDVVSNMPLGILGDVGYEQFEVALDRGDLVLAYTDSLVEARLPDGSEVGTRGLLDVLSRVDTIDPSRVVPGLLAGLAAIGATTNDDVTVVLARCDGRSRGAALAARLVGELRTIGQILARRPDAPWPAWVSRGPHDR